MTGIFRHFIALWLLAATGLGVLPMPAGASGLPVTGGLAFWVKADGINPNDPTEVQSSGGSQYVSRWPDASGHKHDAVQGSLRNEPIYSPSGLNGLPVVRFDGNPRWLGSNLAQLRGNKTIIVVEMRLSTNPGKEVTSSTTTGFFLGNSGSLESKGRIGVTQDLSVAGILGEPIVKSFVRSGSHETLWVNDVPATAVISDSASGTYSISSATSPFNGSIAEILVYDRALGATDREVVEQYLETKWAAGGPPVTSGLQLWMDAASLLPADASEVTDDAGDLHVRRWPSLTANGVVATQGDPSFQPRLIKNGLNALPVVRFGSRGLLTTTLPQIQGDQSIFLVQRRSVATGGTEISSDAGSGIFLGYLEGYESAGRLGVAYDVAAPASITTAVVEAVVRSGTTVTLTVDGTSATAGTSDAAGGDYTFSSRTYPFQGDIAEVLIYNRALSGTEQASVEAYLSSRWWVDDIRSVTPDLVAPTMEVGRNPAPGRRVKQTTPGYEGTGVYHTLYLPRNWVPGRRYPVIVDYPPNSYQPTDGDIPTTGAVEDISLGYGITGGNGYIWLCMPTIGGSPLANQPVWWGDLASTESYCLQTIRYVCERYGGDPSAIILSGFSRGAIACNYLGMNDNTIADVWLAFIPHAHYDGTYEDGGYPNEDAASALTRLERLDGRWQHISQEEVLESPESYLESTGVSTAPFTFETLPYINHCDIWALRPIQLRTDVRAWLATVIAQKPGTYSISGTVVNRRGTPLPGAEVDSGYTHFIRTDGHGRYTLAGLINSSRTVTVSLPGYTFPSASVTVNGANVTGVDFQAQ